MKTIRIIKHAGVFAENKDIASKLREEIVLPVLRQNQELRLDFMNIEGATQSFIHALISQAIREFGSEVLDHIVFMNCNDSIRAIVEIVVDYMQASE